MGESGIARKGGKKNRKFGRAARKPATAKRKVIIMSMKGMMGRKIRALMRSNCYTEKQALKHWRENRERGMLDYMPKKKMAVVEEPKKRERWRG